MVAIFTYGFDVAREAFEKAGVRLTTLSCYSVLAEEARDRGYIDQEGFKTLQAWRESPSTWNK